MLATRCIGTAGSPAWPSSTPCWWPCANDPRRAGAGAPLRPLDRLLLARHPPADLPGARAGWRATAGSPRPRSRQSGRPDKKEYAVSPRRRGGSWPTGWPPRPTGRAAAQRAGRQAPRGVVRRPAGRACRARRSSSSTWREHHARLAAYHRMVDRAVPPPRPAHRRRPRPLPRPARRGAARGVLDRLADRVPGGTRRDRLPRTCCEPITARRPRAAQPRGDGLDAHRARGQAVGRAQAGGVLRRARPRRRRADDHRRLRRQQAGLAQAVRRRDDHPAAARCGTGRSPTRCTRGRRDRAAGAARRALRATTRSASARRPRSRRSRRSRRSALSTRAVDRTVDDFARSVALARKAGYDAVEVMGSEGYLINQFLAARTNDRTDEWGGSRVGAGCGSRCGSCERIRELVGDASRSIYRISLLDLVEGGQTWDEVVELAQRLEQAGVTAFNTGIGWHEARVPTIITQVPRGVWAPWTARLREVVDVPVIASNRINTPELAERLLADGSADLVSMARPFLADPDLVRKAAEGRADEINTCIALQPGLPRPHVLQPDRVLPGQPARLPRDLAGARPDPAPRVGRGRRRRAGRALDRGGGGRARLPGDPVRGRPRPRRPVPAGDGGPRQGGLRRHAALLHAPARGARRRRTPVDPGDRRPTWPGSTRSWSPPASSPGSRTSRASTTPPSRRTPRCCRARSCPAAGWP